MFDAVATKLMEMSPKGFYLTALAVNPNCQFYQSMGGRELAAPDIRLGSDFYPQVGFVWTDFPVSLVPEVARRGTTSSAHQHEVP